MKIIIKFIAFILLSNCNYYIDFWIPKKSIDLSDRQLHGNRKFCSPIFLYDSHFPLCPNQQCKNQWNTYLETMSEAYTKGQDLETKKLNWNARLHSCRKKLSNFYEDHD